MKNEYLQALLAQVEKRNPGEPEFHQAVREVFASLEPVVQAHPIHLTSGVLDCLVEPDRVIKFRFPGRTIRAGCMSTVASASSSITPSAPTRAACAFTPRSTRASSNSSALNRSSKTA